MQGGRYSHSRAPTATVAQADGASRARRSFRHAFWLTHLVLWSLYAGNPKGGTRSMHREQLVGTYALLRRLLREYGRGYLPSYGAAFFFMALVAASTSLTAWIMRDVINQIFVEKSRQALLYVPMAIVVIFAVKGLASYCQETILGRIGNGIVAQTQKRMFDHLLKMDVGFYQ